MSSLSAPPLDLDRSSLSLIVIVWVKSKRNKTLVMVKRYSGIYRLTVNIIFQFSLHLFEGSFSYTILIVEPGLIILTTSLLITRSGHNTCQPAQRILEVWSRPISQIPKLPHDSREDPHSVS